MATHGDATVEQSGPGGRKHDSHELVEYEQYIEDQLRKTRGHVRSVDVAANLMVLVAGTLVYFFLAALVDHWIIKGGLGFWGRLIFLSAYVAAALYYLAAQVLPLVLRRINPLYAAHTIERSRPSLKNGLVNFLLFRANPGELSPRVYQAIEEQAATNLAKVQVEAAVDRTKLIYIGYGLVAIFSVCALYTLFWPKDLLKTAGRVVMPWAEINAPTRTTIEEITPGDAQAFRGQQVLVEARVEGLPNRGKVMLYYSTADGQVVDRALELNVPPEGYKHAGLLPAADGSLQQSLIYRIEAGDAITRPFHIEVVAAPTIVVRSVAYNYPSYTGLLAARVEHQGDIKAIEGTEITLEAIANQPIESAGVDFNCDEKIDVRMQSDGQDARATFTLALKPDRSTPEFHSYQLLFKNPQGQRNPQPVRHQIEVTRDLPPEIQFVSPQQDEIDLPANGAVELEIVANDPDFALKQVKLSAASGGGKQPVVDKVLLDEPWRGQFVKKYRFEPLKLGLKAGEVVDYSALAIDNKEPNPNRTETAKRRIRIVSPSRQAPGDQIAKRGEQGDERPKTGADDEGGGDGEHPRGDNAQDKQNAKKPPQADPKKTDKLNEPTSADDQQPAAEGAADDQSGGDAQKETQSKEGQKEQGAKADKSGQPKAAEQNVPSDGSDDGDAIERILKHRDEQEQKDPKSAAARRPADPKKAGEQQKKGADEPKESPDNAPRQKGKQSEAGEQRGEQPEDTQAPERGPEDKQGDDPSQRDGQQQGDNDEQQRGGGGGQQGDKKKDARPQQPSDKQSDQPDRAADKKDQKGSGAGDEGEGNEGAGGDQSEKDQAGKQGKSARSSRQGKGQGANPGDSGDNPGAKQSKQAGKRQGKADDSKSNDPKDADQAAEPGERGAKGKGSKSSQKPDPAAAKRDQKADDNADGDTQRPDDAKGDKEAARKGGTKDGEGAKREADDAKGAEEATPDESDAGGDAQQGKGTQAKGQGDRKPNTKSSRDEQKDDAEGGDGDNEKGESGAGQKGRDNKGSPAPMNENQPSDKSKEGADDKDSQTDESAQQASGDEKESDSQGQDSGDRSGGGKKGGGQKANRSGTGGAGQNTPADEGAGRSDESGQGETSGRGGADRKTDKKTGKSGTEAGKGSASKSSGGGDKSGKGKQQGNPQQPKSAGSAAGNQQQGQSDDQSGGGDPGSGKAGKRADEKWEPGEEVADEANLEYARKATDLALAHLKDELRKDQPDANLLKRLGWSKQDLERFVRRWEQMRAGAQASGDKGDEARRELDETLRSLGLRPRTTSLKSNAGRDDQVKGLKESRRTTMPQEYQEQSKAYSQGTARGGKK